MPRRPLAQSEELRAEAMAKDLLLREVLPRLLRKAADPDAAAGELLAVIDRRINDLAMRKGQQAPDAVQLRAAAHRIMETALRQEREARIGTLGTDGTP